jgi:glutamate-1-semialdehyde 2,1-aminomutase
MSPYPLAIVRGEGCHLWDADGNRYVDLMQGDWLLPLGHCNPGVSGAICSQVARGTTFVAPEPELGPRLAGLLQRRLPSIERIRFTTSGTEATMYALRLARAATRRPNVAKMRGGYHGTHDSSLLSNYRWTDPDYIPAGLAPGTIESTVLLPFNNLAATRELIETHCDDLAGVIVEPVLGGSGMIPASPKYLTLLRELTTRHGIVLIFDETVTFTYGPHGAQGHYGIDPDLTALGKAIGGGLPLGAFGGKARFMDLVDQDLYPEGPPVRHASTFGGMPVCLAAGAAAVEQLTDDVHTRLHELGARIRGGINELGRRRALPLRATGAAHYFCLHWTPREIRDFDDAVTSDRSVISKLVVALSNEGYLLFHSNGVGVISVPMNESHIDGFVAALDRSLVELGLAA